MHPRRAAWLFAGGLAWLVLRGILIRTFPVMGAEQAFERGGVFLLVPLISLIASLTVPLFFFSFLFHNDFTGQRALKIATIIALTTSSLSFASVVTGFVISIRGIEPGGGGTAQLTLWLYTVVPLLFVASLVVFLAAFGGQSGFVDPRLRVAARIAAVGASVPVVMMVAWIVSTWVPGALPWVPDFSRSLVAKALGLAAAGSLLWFFESFATTYGQRDVAEGGT